MEKIKLIFIGLIFQQVGYGQIYPSMPTLQDSDGTQLPLYQYKTGMRFYFPLDSFRASSKEEIAGYSKSVAYTLNNDPAKNKIITYDIISGKTFELIKIDTFLKRYLWNGFEECYESPFFVLSETDDNKITMSYTFPLDATIRSKAEFGHQLQTLVLPDAVYLDNVESLKKQIAGKTLFAKFQVKIIAGKDAIDGKEVNRYEFQKYLPVNVKDVGTGTAEAPVRIFYQYDAPGEAIQFIDVVTTGTNVLPPFIFHRQLSDFFQFTAFNPNNEIEKENWIAIRKGNVRIGMKLKEVKLALGDPPKTVTTTGAEKPVMHLLYTSQDITLVDGSVVNIVSTDGKLPDK